MKLDRITATTTDEELQAGLAAAHADLAEAATAGQYSKELLLKLHVVAKTEAVMQVAFQVRNARRFATVDESMEAVNERVRNFLISKLCLHPDDEWSGRGNDLQRVKADAVRSAVADAIELL